MKNILIFAIICLAFSTLSEASELKPEIQDFTTDNCSMFLDGQWAECCVSHDVKYWMGGTEQERIKADEDLRACVIQKNFPLTGHMMYYGVRIGGSALLSASWKWGYGWINRDPYKALSVDEKQEVLNKLYFVDIVPLEEIESIKSNRELFYNDY